MEKGTLSVLTIIFLTNSVAENLAEEKCSPCDGSAPSSENPLRSCKHAVTKEEIILSFRAFNHSFYQFKHDKEHEYNSVDQPLRLPRSCTVTEPLNKKVKKHLPRHFKTRFLHETYAKLSYIYDIIQMHFATPSSLKNELMTIMCNMVRINRKLHCKKKTNKPSAKMMDFSKVCRGEDRLFCDKKTDEKWLITLKREGLKEVEKLMNEIHTFWERCVVERKGKLVLRKKCRTKCKKRKGKKRCGNRRNRKKNKGRMRQRKQKRRKTSKTHKL